ncbi:MAG: ArsC family reductase [Pseudomonadota bacterium]|nr:ArsC family reductase [Pseudomonadota bacterium]
MPITLYGIPNCDQVKKARNWLAEHAVPYAFHDFKKSGIDRALAQTWLEQVGWEGLINRRGTTWRALTPARQATIVDVASAKALMIELPSIVKRPILAIDTTLLVGFDAAIYQQTLQK